MLRLGTQKPPRVLVCFVENRFEGGEEWVLPARLKVPWSGVDQLRAHEARGDVIHAAGPDWDDPKIMPPNGYSASCTTRAMPWSAIAKVARSA